jgi:predicted ATPase
VELSRQHLLYDTLAQLSREPVFQRVLLRGISEADTAHFIGAAANIQPSPRLVEAIYTHTEGNPFFMIEVIRLLREQGKLSDETIREPQGFRIPEGVREVIGQRLNRLTAPCHQALTAAAVIGRKFDFRLLSQLSGEGSEEQLLGVIDEALEAHVIEESPGEVERYQFCHALIQQTLTEGLSASRECVYMPASVRPWRSYTETRLRPTPLS